MYLILQKHFKENVLRSLKQDKAGHTFNVYLAVFVQEIFGPETEYELIPGETPVEQLSVNGQNRHEKEAGKSGD